MVAVSGSKRPVFCEGLAVMRNAVLCDGKSFLKFFWKIRNKKACSCVYIVKGGMREDAIVKGMYVRKREVICM